MMSRKPIFALTFFVIVYRISQRLVYYTISKRLFHHNSRVLPSHNQHYTTPVKLTLHTSVKTPQLSPRNQTSSKPHSRSRVHHPPSPTPTISTKLPHPHIHPSYITIIPNAIPSP
ncbi:hypothetical protein BU24DRAFT_135888 [Aaosphaeria arxii CBS 175.79]|uniref:Uncharacterized protein n=1 Tax=Aaosphaeria arxii CBS 175.79 TaxID=1450172 RepID=A0A6A5Y649_9PLEO|nr:uncharacterized protein BU24DRAFT_135888 [Aaosphaeria arxii CBS 175.79]KAF2020241.1 hypothetical protein BU24DRAFT_135888 [Aaosphaeria arxii CBS 175.79]